MVRRRPRATNTGPKMGVTVVMQDTVPTAALTNDQLLEDQFFVIPKRKDCKIDDKSLSNDVLNEADAGGAKPKINSTTSHKMKGENGASNGKIIGVPLATRSQTRTIENFFKAKQRNKMDKYLSEPQKIMQPTLSASVTPPQIGNYNAKIKHDEGREQDEYTETDEIYQLKQTQPQFQSIMNRRSVDSVNMQRELMFDLSEDTNDSERTDLSEEIPAVEGQTTYSIRNSFDFTHHRSSQRVDSHSSSHSSSNTSATENIFLQEPVLTLNVDKSLNQASSIKINKTLEVEPKFSSLTSLTASALHGRFNQIVSLNLASSNGDSFSCEKKPIESLNGHDYALMMLPENDNSSCDSGVALTSTTASLDDTVQVSPAPSSGQVSRKRKPATPHRIVCCSPVKAPKSVVSPTASPSTRKMGSAVLHRKSQRHLNTTTVAAATAGTGVINAGALGKTRRRLHTSYPNASIDPMDMKDKHYVHDVDNDEECVAILENGGEDVDEHTQECENMSSNGPSANENKSNPHALNGKPKSVPNSEKHPANLQNATNNRVEKQKRQQSKTKYTVQRPQHAPLKHKASKTLAATNGNREIDEFFPVRRSVRKTKTAVKEEMMRNLEQAILEERSEGLKVAYFEGKGRGIIADRSFQRGEFVIEYVGDLISIAEAAEREKRYALDETAGCYMYYFKHENQQYCIDATKDTGKLGRLVNHSRYGKLMTKVVVVKQKPHLVLIAKEDIEAGEEVCYDYGDRSKESLLHHPWLAF